MGKVQWEIVACTAYPGKKGRGECPGKTADERADLRHFPPDPDADCQYTAVSGVLAGGRGVRKRQGIPLPSGRADREAWFPAAEHGQDVASGSRDHPYPPGACEALRYHSRGGGGDRAVCGEKADSAVGRLRRRDTGKAW